MTTWTMSRSIVLAGLVVATLSADSVRADGLIYQLPKDGTGVTYQMEINQTVRGKEGNTKGTLSIRSVGQATVDGKECRWIECKLVSKLGKFDQVVISKALIPESELGKGKSPLDHVISNWHKFGRGAARDDKEMAGKGVAIPFLAGPPKGGKEVDPMDIESPLGKLACRGVTGSLDVATDATTIRYDFLNRLHEKAAFGVVTAVWRFEMTKDGQIDTTGTATLTLAEVESDATSELPNNN